MTNKRRKKCYNCKYQGEVFKIGEVKHHHCQHESCHPGNPWESLERVIDTCKHHQFLDEKKP